MKKLDERIEDKIWDALGFALRNAVVNMKEGSHSFWISIAAKEIKALIKEECLEMVKAIDKRVRILDSQNEILVQDKETEWVVNVRLVEELKKISAEIRERVEKL